MARWRKLGERECFSGETKYVLDGLKDVPKGEIYFSSQEQTFDGPFSFSLFYDDPTGGFLDIVYGEIMYVDRAEVPEGRRTTISGNRGVFYDRREEIRDADGIEKLEHRKELEYLVGHVYNFDSE